MSEASRKRKRKRVTQPMAPIARRLDWQPWMFSVGLHVLALILFVLLASMQKPVQAVSEPIQLVDVPTDTSAGDRHERASDRPTAKTVAERVLPQAPVERHAERSEHVESPHRARVSAAPARTPKLARPDLDAMLAKREQQERDREASRVGQLASAADRLLDSEAGSDANAASTHPGGSVDTGSGLTGDLGQRRILDRVTPAYPASAERAGDEGDVRLRVWVDGAGRVERVEIAHQSGTPEMDKRAAEALKRWRFAPLTGGEAETQWGEITLHFRLN